MPAPDLETLVREHAPFLRRLARALVGDGPAADDLVQETWLAAARTRVMRSPRAWLASTARHLAAREYRRRQQRAATLETEPPAAGPDTAAVAAALEAERALLAALDATEEPFRTALYLRYREELGPPAIAERLDVPLATVRSRLRRGLARLRERLDRETEGRGRAMLVPLAFGPGRAAPAAALVPAALVAMKKLAPLVLLLLLSAAWFGLRSLRSEDRASLPDPTASTTESAVAEVEIVGNAPEFGRSAQQRPSTAVPDAEVSPDRATDTWTAEIHLVGPDGVDIDGRPLRVRSMGCSTYMTPRVGVTDATGIVRFEGLPFGRLDIDGYSRSPTRDEPGIERVELVDESPSTGFSGVVVAQGGGPLAGAEVRTHGLEVGPVSVADESGRFEVALPARTSLIVTADGYVPSPTFEARALAQTSTVEMLPAQHTVEGQVLDVDGVPLKDVLVEAHSSRPTQNGRHLGFTVGARTDAEGRFAFPRWFASSRTGLVAHADGLGVLRHDLQGKGPWPTQILRFAATRRVHAEVRREDGAPAAGARVRATTIGVHGLPEIQFGGWSLSVRADASGRAVLDGVPLGEVRVLAESAVDADVFARALALVPAAEADATDDVRATLRLSSGPVLHGRALTPDGRPCAGFDVRAAGERDPRRPGAPRTPRNTVTDADGRFELTSVVAWPWSSEPDDTRWRVELRDPERGMERVGRSGFVRAGEGEVVIVVEEAGSRTASISGVLRVAGEEGVPAHVDVYFQKEGAGKLDAPELDRETGSFRLGSRAPGTYALLVDRERSLETIRGGIDVREGQAVDLGVIELGAGGTVEIVPRLEATFTLPPGAADELFSDQRFLLTSEHGAQCEAGWDDGRWVPERAMEPGRWSVEHRRGEKLVVQVPDLEVRAGENTRVEARARLAQEPRIEIAGGGDWEAAEAALEESGDDGWSVSSGERSRADWNAGRVRLKAPFGTECVVRVRTDTGREGSVTVNVPAALVRMEPVRVTVQ